MIIRLFLENIPFKFIWIWETWTTQAKFRQGSELEDSSSLFVFFFSVVIFFAWSVESYLSFLWKQGEIICFSVFGLYTFLQLKFILWELVFLKTVKSLNPGVIALVGWVWLSIWSCCWQWLTFRPPVTLRVFIANKIPALLTDDQ